MRSRWFINVLLFLSIALLMLVARHEPGIDKTPETQAVTTLQKDQVDRIHIMRPVRDDLLLQRQDNGEWTVQRTPPLPADSLRVASLLKLVEQEPVRSYRVDELDLAKLQLDPPAATLLMNDVRLEFGGLEPLQELRYLRVGERVHLIPDMYQHLIDARFTLFVRRRLFSDGSRIVALRLPGLSLHRSEQGWEVTPEQSVSADALQRLIDRWQQAEALLVQPAEDPVDGDGIEIELENPSRHVTLVIAESDAELVLVHPATGIRYHMGDQRENLLSLPTMDAAASP
jgi:hypothetical protein